MSTLSKRVVALALTGALVLPALSAAEAGPRNGWGDRHGGWHEPHRPDHHKKGRRDDNIGAAVAAGVIGLAAGAILLGAANQPRPIAPPPPVYYPPEPAYYPPAPYPGPVYPGPVHGAASFQPWSPAWYQYCGSKYRSFNPGTGTYTTYRGEQRFCE